MFLGYSIITPADIGLETSRRANLGYAVAAVNDVDGDGVQDLAVSSIGQYTDSPYPEGAVHIIALKVSLIVVPLYLVFQHVLIYDISPYRPVDKSKRAGLSTVPISVRKMVQTLVAVFLLLGIGSVLVLLNKIY